MRVASALVVVVWRASGQDPVAHSPSGLPDGGVPSTSSSEVQPIQVQLCWFPTQLPPITKRSRAATRVTWLILHGLPIISGSPHEWVEHVAYSSMGTGKCALGLARARLSGKLGRQRLVSRGGGGRKAGLALAGSLPAAAAWLGRGKCTLGHSKPLNRDDCARRVSLREVRK